MSSIVLVLIGLLVFYLGFRFYSKFIGNRIFKIHEDDQIMPVKKSSDHVQSTDLMKHIS